jgi:predicted MFS family arabinose efflux permease
VVVVVLEVAVVVEAMVVVVVVVSVVVVVVQPKIATRQIRPRLQEIYRQTPKPCIVFVIGVCALPASVLAGLLWDKAGRRVPFYLSLGLTGTAALLLLFVKKRPRENPDRA